MMSYPAKNHPATSHPARSHTEAVDGAVIQVAQGLVTGYHGIRFGGIARIPATKDVPARIKIAVRDGTGELSADLREGDVLEISGHTWKLNHIHDIGQSWHASLIRIA